MSRPNANDYAGGLAAGMVQPRKRASALVATPCLPHRECPVCDGRLNRITADKAGKYLHQAAEWGRMAARAVTGRSPDDAYTSARRAASFALRATT